jgi:hypothetical protein
MNIKNNDAIFIENALTLLTGGAFTAIIALMLVILS